MPVLIGVDIGTTNVKALALDPTTYRVVAQASAALTTFHPQPGYAEQDPGAIWQHLINVLNNVVGQLAGEPIGGVAFSAAMHSTLAVDAAGQPLSRAILWSDNRAEAQAADLRGDRYAGADNPLGGTPLGRAIYRATGIPLHPMIPLCKLAWFRDNPPDWGSRVHKWISIKEYVWQKLTGAYQIDFSIATATGLFDAANRRWYGPALDYAGIRPEQLSEPVPTTFRATLGRASSANVVGLALPAGTALFAGASDGCLANLGAGGIDADVTTITIGTSGAVRQTVREPLRDEHGRLFCYILDIDEAIDQAHYVVGGPTNNGANVLQWLAEKLTAQDVAAVLTEAARVPPGADGLLFLPYLQGERAPLWDASIRGAYLNVDWRHGRAHFARAALEGVLFNLLSIERLMAPHTGATRVVHANGGFAQSAVWVQMLADVFGVPVRLNASNESGAMGAVLLMQKALGTFATLAEAASRVQFGATFQPDPARHATYQAVFERWQRAQTSGAGATT